MLTPDGPHSPNAEDIQAAYVVMLVIATALVIAINAALIAIAVRFRARRGHAPVRATAGRRTMPRLSGGLALLATAIFVIGVVYTESAREAQPSGPDGLGASAARTAQVAIEPPPRDSAGETLSINAVGQQWLWRYEYPVSESTDQAFQPVFSYGELVVPVDTTVILNVTSTDVVHRWGVPALSGKIDAVPGQTTVGWFKADQEGVYEGRSYQYSGPGYPAMRTDVRVVSAQEYETFVERLREELSEAQEVIQSETESPSALEAPEAARGTDQEGSG